MYKKFLDETGIVNSEVLITSPDTRESEDEACGEVSNIETAFWNRMMDEHGMPKKYETNLIKRFKEGDTEIIIVVDKLLTDTIEPYERGRITELEYLNRVTEYMENVVTIWMTPFRQK